MQLAQMEKAADDADALRNDLERALKTDSAHVKEEVMPF